MTMEEAVARGGLVAARAIISAILVEIHDMHGEEAIRRIRLRSETHVTAARHLMNSEAESVAEMDMARESASIAEGFLTDAFSAAYSAE